MMGILTPQLVEIEEIARGKLYKVEISSSVIDIIFTYHSLDRISIWNLNLENVLDALLYPEEVLVGHFDRFIAHKRDKDHIIRAIYEYDNELPVLVTVYYPTATRYFKGGGIYADKILS